jgi:hypothetical protein
MQSFCCKHSQLRSLNHTMNCLRSHVGDMLNDIQLVMRDIPRSAYNNNNIYLVRPPRGGWLHRGSHLRVAGMPVVPLGSLTRCSVVPFLSNHVGRCCLSEVRILTERRSCSNCVERRKSMSHGVIASRSRVPSVRVTARFVFESQRDNPYSQTATFPIIVWNFSHVEAERTSPSRRSRTNQQAEHTPASRGGECFGRSVAGHLISFEEGTSGRQRRKREK